MAYGAGWIALTYGRMVPPSWVTYGYSQHTLRAAYGRRRPIHHDHHKQTHTRKHITKTAQIQNIEENWLYIVLFYTVRHDVTLRGMTILITCKDNLLSFLFVYMFNNVSCF